MLEYSLARVMHWGCDVFTIVGAMFSPVKPPPVAADALPRPLVAALQLQYNPRTVKTLGYHYVKSTYGMWLPGDERGSWSTAWDEQIGYIQPHMLYPGDPVRRRMAEERMKHEPVRLTDAMQRVVAHAIGECVRASAGGLAIAAAAIESTHVHLLIPYSGRDIHKTAKWLADQTTKAVHRQTGHQGPVWCKGKWCS